MKKLQMLKDTSCSCESCSAMCRCPCWPLPTEVQVLIDAGYGGRLCQENFYSFEYDTDESLVADLVVPALKGYEGLSAPYFARSVEGCTFWKHGLCELHELGLKPIEGRVVHCKSTEEELDNLRKQIAEEWDNEEGNAIFKHWLDTYSLTLEE